MKTKAKLITYRDVLEQAARQIGWSEERIKDGHERVAMNNPAAANEASLDIIPLEFVNELRTAMVATLKTRDRHEAARANLGRVLDRIKESQDRATAHN